MGLKSSTIKNRHPIECQSVSDTKDMAESDEVIDPESNGYVLSNHFVPEEVLTLILSYVPAKELIKFSTVCKSWNQIIKNNRLWIELYKRKYPKKKPKILPWYVYYCLFGTDFFDVNLIKNGNGELNYKYWTLNKNFGDGFIIEDPPNGSANLPDEVEEFNGRTSCFATSFYECSKQQMVPLGRAKVHQKVIDEFKPAIEVSEWVCGRFDCGCVYKMKITLLNDEKKPVQGHQLEERMEQWSNPPWKKLRLKIDDYPKNIRRLIFEHEGKDLQFWKGHYGSKMAGAVVKVLFDSVGEERVKEALVETNLDMAETLHEPSLDTNETLHEPSLYTVFPGKTFD